jgi:hypothetical protein
MSPDTPRAAPAPFVFRLIYRSHSRFPFNNDGLRALHAMLAAARIRNAALDVTGVLYYDGSSFTQLLEGPPDAVETLLRSITADPRHTELEVTSRTMWPHRSFGEWSMALVAAEERQRALGEAGGLPEDPDGFASVMQAVLSGQN